MDTLANSDRLAKAISSLRAAKQYQRDRRAHGHRRVELYFSDIDGDWLSNWEDDLDDSTAKEETTDLAGKVKSL